MPSNLLSGKAAMLCGGFAFEFTLDHMNETTHTKPRSVLWRAIKVFFGAWAFAVAGTIVFAVATLVVGGQGEPTESLRYATPVLFLLGVPIMVRWLK